MTRAEVVRRRATPTELHRQDPLVEWPEVGCAPITVVLCDYDRSTLVLGSAQDRSVIDQRRLDELNIEAVQRRSGGGAVLMIPGDLIWIDVIAQPGVFADDVRTSMVSAGQAWRQALDRLGGVADPAGVAGPDPLDPADRAASTVCRDQRAHGAQRAAHRVNSELDRNVGRPLDRGGGRGELRVHSDAMVLGDWGRLVCFCGLGPGEVTVGGAKLVGLSQRRTRRGVRISGAVHRRSLIAETIEVLNGPLPDTVAPDVALIDDIDDLALAEAVALELCGPGILG